MDGHVTVTMPIHPLKGECLPVLRWLRTLDGSRYVEVELPRGHGLRLPIAWVNGAVELDPTRPRLCIGALVRLTKLIGEKLDARSNLAVVRPDQNADNRRRGGRGNRASAAGRWAGLVGTGTRAEGNASRTPGFDASPVDARTAGRNRSRR